MKLINKMKYIIFLLLFISCNLMEDQTIIEQTGNPTVTPTPMPIVTPMHDGLYDENDYVTKTPEPELFTIPPEEK